MTETGTRTATSSTRPRLGFLGVGWIGQNRMKAIAHAEIAEISAVCEPNGEMLGKALEIAPNANEAQSLKELLDSGIQGLVIATPSALHAEQAIAALRAGVAVFCQKPLGRTAIETMQIVEAARLSDRLLGVDFSYRYINGIDEMHSILLRGELGTVFSADLVFHNAYGPDKPWFFDREQSGGGCMMDLGVHLLDLALWMLDHPGRNEITARLFSKGMRLKKVIGDVEDFGTATIDLSNGTTLNLTCSWNLQAGYEAEISAAFFGTCGGVRLSNINGSFYEFTTERMSGTVAEELGTERDWDWGGRAIIDWAKKLAAGHGFDPDCQKFIDSAVMLDAVYQNAH